jgi:4-amino-4-deoxy-L-arabinose transferase-like glycosyltransferase
MGTRRLAVLLAVLLGAAVVFALPLGRRPLAHQDEARFALLAQEAVEHGRWILPRVRDVVYLNKPPFFFWAMALVSWPFGTVNETTAALPSVLAAVAGLLAVFAIGRLLWGWAVGIVSILVLATAPFYFFMAHQALSDMMLTAWLTWALYFYLAARRHGDDRWRLAGFYLCVGGALGSKGPAGLVVLVAALVVALADDGWWGLRRLRLPMGLAILFLTALPWLPSYFLQGERSYVKAILLGHYVDWVTRSKSEWRFLLVFNNLNRFLPWAVLLVAAVWWWWRHRDRDRRRLLLWTGAMTLAVILSAEQRARYYVPILPLLALLVAEFLVRATAEPSGRGRRVVLVSLVAMLCGTAAFALLLLGGSREWLGDADLIFFPAAGWERGLVAFFAVAGAVAAVAALRHGSGVAVAACIALAMGAVLAVEGVTYPARYAQRYDVRGFAARVVAGVPDGAPLVAYREVKLSYDFYLRRPVREVTRTEEVKAFLASPRPGALLTSEASWADLKGSADPSWQPRVSGTVGRHRMVLVSSQP